MIWLRLRHVVRNILKLCACRGVELIVSRLLPPMKFTLWIICQKVTFMKATTLARLFRDGVGYKVYKVNFVSLFIF